MKILHFSALDGQTGAGIAAARLHEGLLARGLDSRFCVVHPSANLTNAFTPPITLPGRMARAVCHAVDARLLRRSLKNYDYVLSSGACGFDMARIAARERPDIVQLHWIGGGAFRLSSLAGLNSPVVWRMSDQWPFCGLQHLEQDAQAYAAPPPHAPSLTRLRTNISEQVRYVKWKTYRRMNLTLACPSRWLLAETKRSALLGDRRAMLIPTGCDTVAFAPRDRDASRAALGLPQGANVILVGATSMGTLWKGPDLFFKAALELAQGPAIKDRPLVILTFGKEQFDASGLPASVRIEHMGMVRDRRLMSILYNAADVFVAPSRMENLANTVLESLSCSTPTVAFRIGGMPDMIGHKINGFLAPPFETGELAAGMRWALEQRDNPAVHAAARQKILDHFSLDSEIDGYAGLYRNILNHPTHAA